MDSGRGPSDLPGSTVPCPGLTDPKSRSLPPVNLYDLFRHNNNVLSAMMFQSREELYLQLRPRLAIGK